MNKIHNLAHRVNPPSEVKCAHFHGADAKKPIPSYPIYRGTLFDLVDRSVDFVMSNPRNPLIAEPLFLARYVEKAGSGILGMVARCKAVGLPLKASERSNPQDGKRE